MQQCIAKYGPQPATTVVAVDPVTLQSIAAIKLDQTLDSRATIVAHGALTYMYLAGPSAGVRIIWDPQSKTLTQDSTWTPAYVSPGETTGDAPIPLGDWVIFNTNAGSGATVPQCIVAVSQANSNTVQRICPWGATLTANGSQQPASVSVDPETNLIFAQDWFAGGVFAIKLDQATGHMAVQWSRPDWRTSDYLASIGTKDHRVLLSTYFSPNFTSADASTGNWTESLIWVDQATGRTLAQSAFNSATAVGWMPELGYAGRVYTLTLKGNLNIYAVSACTSSSTAAFTPLSTTTCASGASGLPAPVASPPLPLQPAPITG
jgi:hypothetical protein